MPSCPEAAALLRADASDTVFYQVLGLRGELLSGDAALPVPSEDAPVVPWELHYRDDEVGTDAVRVAYLWVSPEGQAGSSKTMLVQVAETLGKRARLTNEIIKGVILPQFVILPLAVLLVWLALARGISPLNELQRRIRSRESSDLSPIDEQRVPDEVAPLVRAINDLLMRLDLSMSRQKHFPGRRGPPAEDAAGRAAHPGRADPARDRCRPCLARRAEALARSHRQGQ